LNTQLDHRFLRQSAIDQSSVQSGPADILRHQVIDSILQAVSKAIATLG
jgi:hypothetical protein